MNSDEYVIIFNHQTINQEEKAEDGKEGEVHEGHHNALELVPVGHRSSLIIGNGSSVIFFEVDVQEIEFLSRRICLNKQNEYFSLFNPKNLSRHMRFLSIKTKNDVLDKGLSGSKGLATCVWKSLTIKNVRIMKKTDVLNELPRPSLFSNKQSPLAPSTVTSHDIPSLYFDHHIIIQLLLPPKKENLKKRVKIYLYSNLGI